ncbi:hypothetical protein HK1_00524 [Tepidibacillus sp. HK-1]|nr:hypothetical protein HK1_00524 [Tepidibacillus sp. HK-1]
MTKYLSFMEVEISAELVSKITDKIIPRISEWQIQLLIKKSFPYTWEGFFHLSTLLSTLS